MPKQYFPYDPWKIIESEPDTRQNAFKESIFSLGNGYMAVRGEIEEGITASDGFSGTYLYGVFDDEPVRNYWPRVGLVSKTGLFVHAPSWSRLRVRVNGEPLDTGTGTVRDYVRELDMHEGVLRRRFTWTSPAGVSVDVRSERFISIHRDHIASTRFELRPLGAPATVEVTTGIDATVRNSGAVVSNWVELANASISPDAALLHVRTTASDISVATAFDLAVDAGGRRLAPSASLNNARIASRTYTVKVPADTWLRVEKIVAVTTSREMPGDEVAPACRRELAEARQAGHDRLREEHIAGWAAFWKVRSLVIEGDAASQQGVHYCYFSLRQIYSGKDRTLNFVPKACGENYGGHYFWDSEGTVLPCYLWYDPDTARELLMFRYKTLDFARAKARLLRMPGAQYPWYTINGREDSRNWEIQLFEIHNNAVFIWAIQRYVDFTDDRRFLADYGLEIMIELARYWAARVTFSERRGQYVINCVVGPDEYHMLVNNDCFTNAMVAHALGLAARAVDAVRGEFPEVFRTLATRLAFDVAETAKWRDISARMYLAYDETLGIHPQCDGYLDLEPASPSDVKPEDIPLQAHWPWDRVLRTQIIKQPDVVLLMNFLPDDFDLAQKRRNYEFYEPRCIHDSSLSPAEHGLLASEVGLHDDAFRYYHHIARLDLDDYNQNADEGLHTTAMCGALRLVIEGFGGLRVYRDELSISPHCPADWTRFAYAVRYRGRLLSVDTTRDRVTLELLEGDPIPVAFLGRHITLTRGEKHEGRPLAS